MVCCRDCNLPPSSLGRSAPSTSTVASSSSGADTLSFNPLSCVWDLACRSAHRDRSRRGDNRNACLRGANRWVWNFNNSRGRDWLPDGSNVWSRGGDVGSFRLGQRLCLDVGALRVSGVGDVDGVGFDDGDWSGIDTAACAVGC